MLMVRQASACSSTFRLCCSTSKLLARVMDVCLATSQGEIHFWWSTHVERGLHQDFFHEDKQLQLSRTSDRHLSLATNHALSLVLFLVSSVSEECSIILSALRSQSGVAARFFEDGQSLPLLPVMSQRSITRLCLVLCYSWKGLHNRSFAYYRDYFVAAFRTHLRRTTIASLHLASLCFCHYVRFLLCFVQTGRHHCHMSRQAVDTVRP